MMRTLVFMLALCATAAQAMDGDIDPSFGTAGYIVQAPADASLAPYGVTIQEDGKVLATGTRWAWNDPEGWQDQAAVWRFLADGTPDLSFGIGGLSLVSMGAGVMPTPTTIIAQADGRIVIAGNLGGFGAVRLHADGSLDTDFGNNGVVHVDCANADPGQGLAAAIAIDAQGRLLLAGSGDVDPGPAMRSVGIVVRLLPDGAVDAEFGVGGCVTVSPADTNATATAVLRSVAIDAADRVYVAGRGDLDGVQGLLAARIDATGLLDAGFGIGGITFVANTATVDMRGSGALLANGRWMLGGVCNSQSPMVAACVLALDEHGVPDNGFGNQGWSSIALAGSVLPLNSLACQSDGKCLLLTTARPDAGPYRQFVVTRFTASGLPDPAFGVSGQAHIEVPTERDGSHIIARALALQSGRPILLGTTDGVPSVNAFFATRLQADLIFSDTLD